MPSLTFAHTNSNPSALTRSRSTTPLLLLMSGPKIVLAGGSSAPASHGIGSILVSGLYSRGITDRCRCGAVPPLVAESGLMRATRCPAVTRSPRATSRMMWPYSVQPPPTSAGWSITSQPAGSGPP